MIHTEQIKVIFSYGFYYMADLTFFHLALYFYPLWAVLEQLTNVVLPILWVGSFHFGSDVGYD